MRPCASLALHLHQVVQGTFTPKLLSMPGTLELNRFAAGHFRALPREPRAHQQARSIPSQCSPVRSTACIARRPPRRKEVSPVSELRTRMIDDMTLRGMAAKTQDSYL